MGWTWQKWAGKLIVWAPAMVKLTLDALEITQADWTALIAAAVAILSTLIGLFPAKQETVVAKK